MKSTNEPIKREMQYSNNDDNNINNDNNNNNNNYNNVGSSLDTISTFKFSPKCVHVHH